MVGVECWLLGVDGMILGLLGVGWWVLGV